MEKSIINQVPLFSTLPPAEIEALADTLREGSYPAQTVLFREGEYGDRFYIVLEGQIAILKALDTPNERLLAIRGPGEFIGEMSLLNPDGLRTASVRLHSDARLLEMTRGEFDALLGRKPTIAYEMLRVLSKRLRQAHNESIRELKEKNRKLTEAYAHLKAAQEQIIQKEILERELLQAREIQESILPGELPSFEGFDLGARMLPAHMVGGDFFDIIPLDSDNLAIVIGDVSGKGVPAALFMALTRSLLRAEAGLTISPQVTLQRVNRLLLGMNARGLFVTVLYGILHRTKREFVYVRAAHEVPILMEPSGQTIPVSLGRGQPLGIFPNPVLETQSLQVTPSSTFLLYTDGVTEARNERNEFFEFEGLQATMPRLIEASAQEICDGLVQTLLDYHGSTPRTDDITVVGIKAVS